MTILPFGDSTILINFEQKIDAKINSKVVALSNAITAGHPDGVTFCIPAYCSITVGFTPDVIQYEELKNKMNQIYTGLSEIPRTIKSRKINIPVCYDDEFATDSANVMNHTGLSWNAIIELHTSKEYRVYMLGFIAGFAYMGTLPWALKCHRKGKPQLDIPAGTIGIAGLQTGIYPTRAHAGWQLIGRTPLPVFNPKSIHPFLFQPGDKVLFYPIEADIYYDLKAEAESDALDLNKFVSHV